MFIWRLLTRRRLQLTSRRIKSSSQFSSSEANTRNCIFSGIQPTGIPHLGNYFGAIKQWVELQNSGKYDQVVYSVVDMHSITLPHNPADLRKNTLDMVACLVACGIDPSQSILFQQSCVHEHAELAWILGCLTTMPRIQALPAWKEKSENMKEVPLGLFTYPVLQAADVLLYRATHVPVGDDQVKHIELARDIAGKFNQKFGKFFPKPKCIVGNYKRLRSLRNPNSKMSKSETNNKSRLELLDSPDDIRNKFKKAVTDGEAKITYDPITRPGVSNLLDIHAALTDRSSGDIAQEVHHMNKVPYKEMLADLTIQLIEPIRQEVLRLQSDPGHLLQIIDQGNAKASEIASHNMRIVKQSVGYSSPPSQGRGSIPSGSAA